MLVEADAAQEAIDATRAEPVFVWSVIPALLAWPALLLPATAANAPLLVGFLAHYWQDRGLVRRADRFSALVFTLAHPLDHCGLCLPGAHGLTSVGQKQKRHPCGAPFS